MGGPRLTIGSVRGIDIRIHRSWLLIALLIAWSFYSRYATDEYAVTTTLVMATVGTILFFGSVLVHELAHSLEAQHRGVEVSGITLFLFGGATETRFDVDRPRDEFALTAVGPFSSFVLGAAFALVAFYASGAGLDPVAQVAGTLGWVNVALGIFNLLPGAPLDGGRILRSAVWAVTGDRQRAVRVASRAGQGLGYLIAAIGILQLFFVPGGLVGGIWFIFIGWFLAGAAGSELVQQRLKRHLAGLTVDELVGVDQLPGIGADEDLERAAQELRRRPEDVLAVERDGRDVGVLLLDDVAGVRSEERRGSRVADLAIPLEDLRTVPADTPLAETLEMLGGDDPIVVVDEHGSPTVHGIITPERLQRVVKRTVELEEPPRRRGLRKRSRRDRGHIPQGGTS